MGKNELRILESKLEVSNQRLETLKRCGICQHFTGLINCQATWWRCRPFKKKSKGGWDTCGNFQLLKEVLE